MKIHTLEQGSLEWLMLRAGKVTASGFDNLMTPKLAIREGEMPKTYLASLLSEWWQGGPHPGFSTFATEQGSILEGADAVPWFEFEHNCTVQKVGFITDDAETYGCSPDGIIDGHTGLEVKCAQAVNHTKWLLANKVPDDYLPQIHFSLFVTGFKQWRFLAYRRGFPALVLTVERDEAVQAKIAMALASFTAEFEKAKARLIEINGGPPRRLTPMTPMPKKDYILKPTTSLHEIGVTP